MLSAGQRTVLWAFICLVELVFLLRDQFIELAPVPFVLCSALTLFTSLATRPLPRLEPLSLLLSWLLGLIVFYFITVLFGAPPLDPATVVFAATMTALVWLPASLYIAESLPHRSSVSLLPIEMYFRDLAPRTLAWSGMTAMIGAYLGAAAIPLDWDRWWQRWPLPCLIGGVGGLPLGFAVAALSDYILTH